MNIHNSEIAAIDWNELDVIQEDFSIANVSTPRSETPPTNTTEVPSAANTTGFWMVFAGVYVDAVA